MSVACVLALHRVLQTALQGSQRAAYPRLDRAERLAHLRRDLGMAEALEERERDALPLRRRELVQARRERARLPCLAQQVERSRRVVGHGVVHVFVLVLAADASGTGGARLGLGLLAA